MSELYENFDPVSYVTTYSSLSNNADPLVKELAPFQLEHLHKFYVTTGPKLTRSGCRILEYGGGPGCVHTLISAAPYASEIVFSEYAEQNREAARKWKSSTSDTSDQTHLFEHVVFNLEKRTEENAAQEREKKLRSLISEIVPCDINDSVAIRDVTLPFDIISTHFCLVAAVSTVEQYVSGLKKLSRLLRPGGMIVMSEAIGSTYYQVGNETMPNVCLSTSEVVRESLLQAGFIDVSMKAFKPPPSSLTDCSLYAMFTAVLSPV
ncbi:indolethylamine N-methyltransferase-like [Corticium candelabrum]|uniref:indolethylamine N-methyltransferase-like n=1 Tax=Corticium candelabrum TaxID=121492 RepID=UPI002E26C327|nr:indolethylamine N-methyltransferase-like [Corticium candelabrum]